MPSVGFELKTPRSRVAHSADQASQVPLHFTFSVICYAMYLQISKCTIYFLFYLFFDVFFILYFRDRECEWGREVERERKREGERERILSRLHTQCRARCGALFHDCEIMT